jgi:anti-sigma factor RsiW
VSGTDLEQPCGQHLELGAYVLGGLEPAERLAFEHHLTTCRDCRAELAELAGLPPLLGRLSPVAAIAVSDQAAARSRSDPPGEARADPLADDEASTDGWASPDGWVPAEGWARTAPEPEPGTGPGPGRGVEGWAPTGGWPDPRPGESSGRAGGATAPRSRARPRGGRPAGRAGRAGRRRRRAGRGVRLALAGLAAVVLAAGLFLGVSTFAGHAGSGDRTVALAASSEPAGTAPASGTARLTSVPSGTDIAVRVRGIPPGTWCAVVVVGEDGSRRQVATWYAGYEGAGEADATAPIAVDQVRQIMVRDMPSERTLLASRPT